LNQDRIQQAMKLAADLKTADLNLSTLSAVSTFMFGSAPVHNPASDVTTEMFSRISTQHVAECATEPTLFLGARPVQQANALALGSTAAQLSIGAPSSTPIPQNGPMKDETKNVQFWDK